MKNKSTIKENISEINSNNEENQHTYNMLSQKDTLNCHERNVSIMPRAILTFYRDNKFIINLNETEFKEWLKSHYLAYLTNNKFIATNNSVENGYMINSKKAIIDLEELTCCINYSALITSKGQNYILDYFEEVQNERK